MTYARANEGAQDDDMDGSGEPIGARIGSAVRRAKVGNRRLSRPKAMDCK